MDMKKLIESMDHIDECGMVDEGPMAAMAPPAPEMDKGNPVTVNVSMNASGKEHVADLLDMMKNAGLGGAEVVGAPSLGMRGDMDKFRSAMDDDPEIPGDDDNPDDQDLKAGTLGALGGGALGMALGGPLGALTGAAAGDSLTDEDPASEDEIEVEGDYANEPDAQYGDMSDAIPDGNDLNRKKKSYAATQDGDNPMAVENIKAALYAALTEKKKTMVKGPDGKMVPDYAADGKGKGDLKKDTKTTEGRGKVMAGRGRGKDKLMAGRGRGKKK